MGALELRLHDINERLAASSAEAAALERLLRRREAVLETGDDLRARLEEAAAEIQKVETAIRSSPGLFHYSLHRRRLEGFLERSSRAGFTAAALFLVLEHGLSSLREELDDLEARLRVLSGSERKHRMLLEWRDELIGQLGAGRMVAAQQALARVSAAVTVASGLEDVRIIDEARDVAVRAHDDLEAARKSLEGEGRLEKDDLAALADLIPEGTRHFGLREAKRRVEQATLRLGFMADELRSIRGLNVALRHPFFAMESFLNGLFDDLHGTGLVVQALTAVEDSQGYLQSIVEALDGAAEAAQSNLEDARAAEARVVGRAVDVMPSTPARIKTRYSVWDPPPRGR